MKTTKIVTSAIVLTTLGLVAAPAVHAATTNTEDYKQKGNVGFIENDKVDPTDPVNPTDPTKPVDPTDPTDPENPGTEGPLSIDFASNLNFHTDNKVSGNTETYYADPISAKATDGSVVKLANYVQVTDNRGTNGGWELSVSQAKQFNDGTSDLDGAALTMSTQVLNSTNKSDTTTPGLINGGVAALVAGSGDVKVAKAEKGQGMGTWTDSFGTYTDGTDADTSMKAVALEVPGTSAKTIGSVYKTELTWTLTDANM